MKCRAGRPGKCSERKNDMFDCSRFGGRGGDDPFGRWPPERSCCDPCGLRGPTGPTGPTGGTVLSSSLMAESTAPQQLAAANTPISLASHTMLVGNAIARTSQPSEISILTPGLYEIYYRGVAQATGEGIVFPYTISSVVALNGVPVENTRATRTVANASQAVTLSQSTATLIRSTEVGSFVLRSESPGVTWSNVVVMAAKLTDGI